MFLFKSKKFDPTRFESELQYVSSRITKNEKRLRKYVAQRRHYQRVIPLYLTTVYVAYFSYVYKFGDLLDAKTVVRLITIPVIIGVIYYVVLAIFSYLINKTEASLEYWKNEHREKLDTLKERTNFDKTKELLARFSNGEDLKEMEKEAEEINKKRQEYIELIQSGEKGKIFDDLKKNANSSMYDYFITKLLGENEMEPDNRYALICSTCFAHNGLAPPGKLAKDVQYKCPNCGTMNGCVDVEPTEIDK